LTFLDRVPVFAAALWWGGAAAIGAIAVPLLFANLPLKADAGRMAAKLFTAEAWLAVGCGMVLLMWIRRAARHDLLGWVLGGMLLALLNEFAVAPRIVARDNLALWHSVGSAMYLVQWVCAGVTLWRVSVIPAEAGTQGIGSSGFPPSRE
jgi:hypothetical protein